MIVPVGTCITLSTVPPAPAPKSCITLNSSFFNSPNGPESSASFSRPAEDPGFRLFVFVDGFRGASSVEEERGFVDEESLVPFGVISMEASVDSSSCALEPGRRGALRIPSGAMDFEMFRSTGFFRDIFDFPPVVSTP